MVYVASVVVWSASAGFRIAGLRIAGFRIAGFKMAGFNAAETAGLRIAGLRIAGLSVSMICGAVGSGLSVVLDCKPPATSVPPGAVTSCTFTVTLAVGFAD